MSHYTGQVLNTLQHVGWTIGTIHVKENIKLNICNIWHDLIIVIIQYV